MKTVPLLKLSYLAEDNADLDMREILGINKAFQSTQGELVNNKNYSNKLKYLYQGPFQCFV